MRYLSGKGLVCILALTTLVIAGCHTTPGQVHPWSVRPEIAPQESADWMRLDSSRYGLVGEAKRAEAIRKLEVTPAVAIDPQEVGDWIGVEVRPPIGGGEPYLVRGLAHGESPVWVDVWVNRSTGELWVDQATYGAVEPTLRLDQRAMPLVVYLDRAPPRVCTSATVGTDRVLVGRGCAAMMGGRQHLAGPTCSLKTWEANITGY